MRAKMRASNLLSAGMSVLGVLCGNSVQYVYANLASADSAGLRIRLCRWMEESKASIGACCTAL